jgi:hypothetical protein
MHKERPVADLTLDEATCAIVKIGAVHAAEHVPVGVTVKNGEIDRAALNKWWRNRAIPASRQGIRDALQELDLPDTQSLLDKCFGLSLSDQYWNCSASASLKWAELNFFENPFSDDVGNILFGKRTGGGEISLMSPDNTSDGWLRKKWIIIDGRRCLIKGGSGATRQEPYNEALSSAIMRRLNIPYVPYTLTVQDECPFSVCEDFVTPQTELISAWHVMQTQKKENHVSVYRHYLNCCDALGIPGVRDALDGLMVLDYLIANEDRHQNNFGVLRDADTLAWIGPAPVYDSGASLWFSSPVNMIRPDAPMLPCKPFKTSHSEQIKLVSSFDWVDISALDGIDGEFREIVKDSPFVDAARRDALCRALRRRVELLAEVMRARVTSAMAAPDWSAEVETDVAYSGED